MIMKRTVLFFTALVFMLSYSFTYGQSGMQEESINSETDIINRMVPCDDRFGTSWSGHSNVNCNQYWQNEKDAVVRIEFPLSGGGCDYCSGALINTTAGENNNRHFILTAGHCLPMGNNPDLSQWNFYWHYESSGCSNPNNVPPLISTQGAKRVARHYVNGKLDFLLLELDEDPAEAWDVTPYYLGWDRGNAQTSGTIIHHPMADIKKIATAYGPFQSPNPPDWAPEYFWRFSTTFEKLIEGGSSGSPMLNSSHKLIGICNHSVKMTQHPGGTYYLVDFSKFGYAWEGVRDNPDSTCRLKDWLDPLNTGATTLNGRSVCQNTIKLSRPPIAYPKKDYHAVQNIISKQEIKDGAEVTYKAGIEIVLQDGFRAKSGANFSAVIEELECNGTNTVSYSPQKDEAYGDIVIEDDNFPLSQIQVLHKFNIIPNPNPGVFQLETNFPLSDIGNLKITNTMGVTVYETQNVTEHTIQLQNTASGLFFVVIILKDGNVLTQKMMVQR